MMRWLAALLGACLVGVPLLLTPSAIVALPAGVATALIAAGVFALRTSLITAGICLALIEYGLALLIGARPLEPFSAVAMGEVLLLLLQVVHFARRARGAHVMAAVVASQVRYWLRLGIVAIALGLGASVLALRVARPAAVAPVLAAAGAIAVLTAATCLARHGQTGV